MGKGKKKKNRGPSHRGKVKATKAPAHAKQNEPDLAKKVPAAAMHKRQDGTPDWRKMHPVWQLHKADLEPPYSWTECTGKAFKKCLDRLRQLEAQSWNEILGHHHHLIEVDQISKEAQKRLVDLKCDEIADGRVLSLRVTGGMRAFGVLYRNVCMLLWWDPEHEICPSNRTGN